MITINPIPRALFPKNTESAKKITCRNYDEFQGAEEIISIIKESPQSILSITMPHCNIKDGVPVGAEESPEAYAYGAQLFKKLINSEETTLHNNVLAVYKIADAANPSDSQTGIIGYGKVSEIRTPETPGGSIIRNEGIREKKVVGRAKLIKETKAYIGVVNNTIDDKEDHLAKALDQFINNNPVAFEVTDELNFLHTIWIVDKQKDINNFKEILKAEDNAYVADGNHRSAAAASLKYENFLCVFFPIKQIHIIQYNRLLDVPIPENILNQLEENFEVEELKISGYQPKETHNIGMFFNDKWYKLTPKTKLIKDKNPAEGLDPEIVQRYIIRDIFGIDDINDERLNFTGGDRDTDYLVSRIKSGEFTCTITLPPVTKTEFVNICRQNLLMPPKSTWFQPKVRSGLVIGLL